MTAEERIQALAHFEHYRRFARRLVYEWATARGVWRNHGRDLTQEAYLGLWEACRKLDGREPEQRARYVKTVVMGRVFDSIRARNDLIHIPRDVRPKDRPRAHAFTSLEAWRDAGDSRRDMLCETFLAELGRTDPEPDEAEDTFWSLCWDLRYEHIDMLWAHYGEGKSLAAIGRDHGITDSRVCKILHQCRARLKQSRRVQRARAGLGAA